MVSTTSRSTRPRTTACRTPSTSLGVETGEVESQSDPEYADNINRDRQPGLQQITTVGFLLGDATAGRREENPDVDFAIVDFAYEKPSANLKGLVFNTAEPSFLAGYLAAGMSETGNVGTFGGLNIPTVTIFMDRLRQGVEQYNEDNGADVKVSAGTPTPRRARSPTTSRTRPRARPSART